MRHDDDADRELKAHLEQEIEEQMADGKSRDDARAAALRTLGNVTLAKEQVRELSLWAWWEQLWQDVRLSLRVFRRNPAFPLTAILTLALGVGANGAIFSVIDALLLRPLPVDRPEQLVVVRDIDNGNFSYPDYASLRDGTRTLTALMAASFPQRGPVLIGADAETATAKMVSDNYFATLGVPAAAGRVLEPGDERTAVAVISHGYWTSRFGRSGDVLGRSISFMGQPLTIVGIAPAGFFGEAPGDAPDFWLSLAMQRPQFLRERGFSWLYVMGRLAPGATDRTAQADLAALFTAASPEPARQKGPRISVTAGASGASAWRNRVGSPLWVLMAIVALVLLIACTNLATLLLTRGTARAREIAMRLAIGASRPRLVRQLLTETLLLSLAGGALSLALAAWGGPLLAHLASAVGTGPDLRLDLRVDARLLLFTAAASLAAGLFFGLVPSIREVRRAGGAMSGSHDRVVGAARVWGLRGVLIALQVALSLVLVAGSVMFLRSLRNLQTMDLGFQPAGLVRVEIENERGYEPPADIAPRLIERAAAIPGVLSATAVGGGTLANMGGVTGVEFEGYTPRDAQDRRARADWVGPGYFRTAGITMKAGREFLSADDDRARRVVVVNQTAARHYFGEDSAAIGRRLTWNHEQYEIVGVAGNAKYADLREQPLRVLYFPILQSERGMNAIEIRTTSSAAASVAPAIRSAVREVDARLFVGEVLTATERVDRKLGQEHLVSSLSTFFGALTVLLVSVGIYGTVAYSARRRTKELGLRLALGARRGGMMWLVLRDLLSVVVTGVLAGSALTLAVGRLVRSLLYGLEPADPLTFAAAAGLLLAVAALAGLLPALRASRLDPATVLRES